jgi:hypothetical protein
MRAAIALALAGCAARPDASTTPAADAPVVELESGAAQRIAAMALACVHREYPNKIAHVLADESDVKSPRALTPAFYGCFDWHSAVHGHWTLVRLLRTHPRASFVADARAALDRTLTADNIAGELAYLSRDDRAGFERPYGLAWLLQLAAELRAWNDADARRWSETLVPLERLAAQRLRTWLPKLTHAVRVGEHAQSAFAMALALDWARVAGDRELAALIERRAIDYHGRDRGCDLAFEPSGQDFLSPCLGAADLVRRVLPADRFADWLDVALPDVPRDRGDWLEPLVPSDRSDGKLVHLDGLNLSRAWMLAGIAAGLPSDDPRRASLRGSARRHASAGLAALAEQGYEGAHWLGTFATYAATTDAASPHGP